MPRKMSKHAPAKVQCTIRQRQVAELRAQKLTMQEIADKLGISRPRVHQLLEAWDENFRTENKDRAEQIIQQQLDEIKLLKNTWFPLALKDVENTKALDAYVRLLAQEAKVAGVAQKTELTGANGGPLETASTVASFDLSRLSDEQLAQLESLQQLALPETQSDKV